MAIGDKFVVTLHSFVGGASANPFANVFAYEGMSGGSSAPDLATTFNDVVVDELKTRLSTGTFLTEIDVINLDNLADFAILPIAKQGTLAGDFLPIFNAIEFEYVRGTRAVHSGRKSFGAVPRDQQVDGIPVGGYLTILASLAAVLGADLTSIATFVYTPRIWRRAGVYGSSHTTFPDTFYPISSVRFGAISTQNTRKR